jgi:mRNA interferase MazF
LARFPFGDAPGMKLRPVLILTDRLGSIPEVLVAYISSVIPDATLPTDLILEPHRPEWAGIGLKANSVIRLHKLATIHASSIVRKLGRLPHSKTNEIRSILRAMLHL